MPAPMTLVLFIADWGMPLASQKPFLNDVISAYPLKMIQNDEPSLIATYRMFSTVYDRHQQPLMNLTGLLSDSGIKSLRIADPDRYAALTQGNQNHSVLIPFPPGASLVDAYDSTVTLLKKRVLQQIWEGGEQVVFASFSGIWTAGMYGDPVFVDSVIAQTSQAITLIIDAALEEGINVLLVGDNSGLAPCVLVHPQLEGLRMTGHDVSDGRDLPRVASGHARQIASTIATLLHIPLPSHAQPSLFTL